MRLNEYEHERIREIANVDIRNVLVNLGKQNDLWYLDNKEYLLTLSYPITLNYERGALKEYFFGVLLYTPKFTPKMLTQGYMYELPKPLSGYSSIYDKLFLYQLDEAKVATNIRKDCTMASVTIIKETNVGFKADIYSFLFYNIGKPLLISMEENIILADPTHN